MLRVNYEEYNAYIILIDGCGKRWIVNEYSVCRKAYKWTVLRKPKQKKMTCGLVREKKKERLLRMTFKKKVNFPQTQYIYY